MKVTKFKSFIFLGLMIFMNSFGSNYLVRAKQNSILKTFCLHSVKKEMLRAEIEYSEKIANETCQCYYEEFIQTSSHQDAKTKCKLKAKENFK